MTKRKCTSNRLSAPTTANPTTSAPTTANPTTANPTTVALTTSNPTTAEPTSAAPTSNNPTTDLNTTAYPTTAAPTTISPTQGGENAVDEATTTKFDGKEEKNVYEITVSPRTADNNLNATRVKEIITTVLNITDITLENDNDNNIVLIVNIPSNSPLNQDKIKQKVKEGIVQEYGNDVDIDVSVKEITDKRKDSEGSSVLSNTNLIIVGSIIIALLCCIICLLMFYIVLKLRGKQRGKQIEVELANNPNGDYNHEMAAGDAPITSPSASEGNSMVALVGMTGNNTTNTSPEMIPISMNNNNQQRSNQAASIYKQQSIPAPSVNKAISMFSINSDVSSMAMANLMHCLAY